jgi:transcriptional regulator GlxA family with amidase domain
MVMTRADVTQKVIAAKWAKKLTWKALADACGRSHRHFIAGFRDAAGLAPKRYARVLRFQRLLAVLAATPRPAWAQLALDAGYFDQSHLIREFREFAGVSPREYAARAPASPNHLPLD